MRLTARALATYATETTFDDLSDSVVDRLTDVLLDSIACSVGAFSSPPSKALRRQYGGTTGGDKQATIFGTRQSVNVEYAALLNSSMVRYLDFNDCYSSSYGNGHPSDHIPALISVAEAENASGADLAAAIAVAYDIQCTGLETGVVYEQGFDHQSVWGSFSAPAAIGKLMGLTEDELVMAIGISGTANNGLRVARRGAVSMWKGVAMPYVVHNAIQACQMVRSGLTGPAQVFEGQDGVFDVLTGHPVELEDFTAPGARILQTNLKKFAACYDAQAAITGLLDLIDTNDISPQAIESIDVGTYGKAVTSLASPEKWGADITRETADHSLPYLLATATLHGDVTPTQYEPAFLTDPSVHELMQRVSINESPTLTDRRREESGMTPAIVEIATADSTYSTTRDYPAGHHRSPMSSDDLEAKATALLRPLLTSDQIDGVREGCRDIASLTDIGDFVRSFDV